MRRTRYTAVFFLFSILSYGQADSLINYSKQVEGKEKIDVLHQIILELWLNYPDRAMGYGEQALELSRQEGDSMLISKSLRLIAGVYYYRGDFNLSLEYNQKALAIALQLKDSSLINNG